MRRILTREQRDKKNKRNQLIIGIVLITVLLFSTFGYAFNNDDEGSSEKVEYNGIDFIQDNSGYWRFSKDGKKFVTRYNPLETEDVLVSGVFGLNDYSDNPLYLVSESQEVIYEIVANLNQFILRPHEACLNEESCERDLPIKNCSVDNVVVVREGEDKGVVKEEKCVFITSDLGNQTRYADAFLFKVLGI